MTTHPAPRQILVLPHAIDRYIERALRDVPPRPRCLELDEMVAAAIRAAIVRPGATLYPMRWTLKGVQRVVRAGDLRIVVRGGTVGMVVTVMGERERP